RRRTRKDAAPAEPVVETIAVEAEIPVEPAAETEPPKPAVIVADAKPDEEGPRRKGWWNKLLS
ncbi:MAG: hypothetical protein HQL40_08100, partial [Alphaproteobacteria bacterium]|nr:hypothetical protein [Alphaproteobacteria bacterium]